MKWPLWEVSSCSIVIRSWQGLAVCPVACVSLLLYLSKLSKWVLLNSMLFYPIWIIFIAMQRRIVPQTVLRLRPALALRSANRAAPSRVIAAKTIAMRVECLRQLVLFTVF